MEFCDYQVVNTTDGKIKDNSSWKYFFRQILIASAVWTQYFTAGLCVGTPTVLIPQWIKQNNITLDEEVQSWIYSCPGFSAIPWVLVVPTLSTYIGRKIPYIISGLNMLIVFTILYFSTTIYDILISEALQGFAHSCNITITILIVSEYVDPKYRGIYLTIKSASFFWGMWAANAIGTFFHWRYIALTGIFCAVYSLAGSFHPESPHWLASKRRFEKARASFRWLHGCHEKSEKELEAILESHASKRERKARFIWQTVKDTMRCREFYLPMTLALVMAFQYHFSGKLVCSTYAVDMIHRITGNEEAAYTGMLILDGVTVLGMYIGSFMSKVLKRRTLYMSASFIGVIFLFVLALYLFLIRLEIISNSNVVAIVLLMIYSISISCGPMIMSMTVTGEIIPMKYQVICFSIQASIFTVVYALLMKFAPFIFNSFGMDGSFLFYGILSGASLVGLFFYLPETKDKTLIEIEEYFKGTKRDNLSLNLSEEKTVF